MPFEIKKEVEDTAIVFSRRQGGVPDRIVEGSRVLLSPFSMDKDFEAITHLKNDVLAYITENKGSYVLHLVAEEKCGKIGVALIEV